MKNEVSLTQAARLLAGRPTCLLTVRYRGHVNVMTVAWVMPVSVGPPLVAMAIHPSRYTHDILLRSEEFVLNIPGRALAEHLVTCGSMSGEDEDKIKRTGLVLDSGHRVEVPWIIECLAHLECVVVDRLMPGDHTVFVAEIVGAWAENEAFRECWLLPEDSIELSPVLYLGGALFSLMGPILTAQDND